MRLHNKLQVPRQGPKARHRDDDLGCGRQPEHGLPFVAGGDVPDGSLQYWSRVVARQYEPSWRRPQVAPIPSLLSEGRPDAFGAPALERALRADGQGSTV